ncbi:hypothetical protein MIZ01_0832 [Sideroxyarcus emersonii]|uniref:Uncharacterized protein n=1 Tax=Sideroxyarcus emersonii TaxID=2764705 RepID=A0AAN1X9I3_9PROT|nr:hypothetical protein [Sideroxyarcus emersonii]BCK87062.1 hypothetical protein MIZ01_0832 [Sideroxyarcus emersonii]
MRSKCLSIGLALLLFGCKGEVNDDWQKSAIPPIRPDAAVKLRVVHAINPRLARFSPDHLKIILASAQLTVWKNFGVYIEFTDVPEMRIDQLFALIPPAVMQERLSSIYDFKSGKGDRQKLVEGIDATLTERGTKLEDALSFAAPYLPANAHPEDLMALSGLLADVMLERLQQWRRLNAADGAPVLDASPYNEWVYWDTLGYGNLPYDLVITNQPIASAEYYGADLHSAIRGGLTVGTTSFSRDSKYGSYIVMSTFPFQDDSALTKLLRGGEQYSEEDAAELAGAYLAHEIGHLLFQLGHPFGQKSCVMNPVSMLRFREWARQLDGAECRIGSRPEMTAGAIPPTYNAAWMKMLQPR